LGLSVSRVPIRTCLACGRKAAKDELLRLCREASGTVTIDSKQKLPGRGAYVCMSVACAERLARRKGLHHGFRTRVPENAYTTIIDYIKQHAPQ